MGVVCYYGRHYSTFFFQTRIRRWIYIDDAHVKEVRPSRTEEPQRSRKVFPKVSVPPPGNGRETESLKRRNPRKEGRI